MYGRSSGGPQLDQRDEPARRDDHRDRARRASCRSRVRSRVGPATRYTSPNAGTTSSACPIFVRNPKPDGGARRRPATTSTRAPRPRRPPAPPRSAPATSSSVSSASGLSNRNISTAAGVSASAAPASSPATGPAQRRTAAYSRATEATPISACGTSRLHEENPKSRARGRHHPERRGRLVDRDRVAGVERAEQPGLPATACRPARRRRRTRWRSPRPTGPTGRAPRCRRAGRRARAAPTRVGRPARSAAPPGGSVVWGEVATASRCSRCLLADARRPRAQCCCA